MIYDESDIKRAVEFTRLMIQVCGIGATYMPSDKFYEEVLRFSKEWMKLTADIDKPKP